MGRSRDLAVWQINHGHRCRCVAEIARLRHMFRGKLGSGSPRHCSTASQKSSLPAPAGLRWCSTPPRRRRPSRPKAAAISAFKKRFPGRRLLLAPLPEGTSVRLINDGKSAEVDLAKDKHLQLQLLPQKHATIGCGPDGRLPLEGPSQLLLHSPHCATTRIRRQSAVRASVAGEQTWTITPSDNLWQLNTPKTSFEAKIAEDGSDQPCSRPIEISARDGKLKHFCLHAKLLSTTLALEHVDRTRSTSARFLSNCAMRCRRPRRNRRLTSVRPQCSLTPRPAPR